MTKETDAYRPATADEWTPFAPESSDSERSLPQGGSPKRQSADDLEFAFTAAILQIAERVAPPRVCTLPGQEWTGDAQVEAEINMPMSER